MAKVKVVSVPASFPFGKTKVDKIAPSTGPYGKRVSGKPPINAVRIRKGR